MQFLRVSRWTRVELYILKKLSKDKIENQKTLVYAKYFVSM